MISKEQLSYYIERINKAINYVDANLDKQISLKDLAGAACFSEFHFHRIFQMFTGETPYEYINRYRMQKAANLLIFNENSVADVAFLCGFTSSAIFARSFKAYFKISATQWRKEYKSKICKHESKESKNNLPLKNYLLSANEIFSELTKEENFMESVEKRVKRMKLAYVSCMTGYDETAIGNAWKKICSWAGRNGIFNQSTKMLGISFDNPQITPRDKCRYYACLTIAENIEPKGEIGEYVIPECDCRVYHYEGNGAGIETAYQNIFHDFFVSGFQTVDFPAFEIYTKECDEKKDHYSMDIYIPIKIY